MKKIVVYIFAIVSVSSCNVDPVLTVGKKEVISSPLAFIIFMSVLMLLFSIKTKKTKKKPKQ